MGDNNRNTGYGLGLHNKNGFGGYHPGIEDGTQLESKSCSVPRPVSRGSRP